MDGRSSDSATTWQQNINAMQGDAQQWWALGPAGARARHTVMPGVWLQMQEVQEVQAPRSPLQNNLLHQSCAIDACVSLCGQRQLLEETDQQVGQTSHQTALSSHTNARAHLSLEDAVQQSVQQSQLSSPERRKIAQAALNTSPGSVPEALECQLTCTRVPARGIRFSFPFDDSSPPLATDDVWSPSDATCSPPSEATRTPQQDMLEYSLPTTVDSLVEQAYFKDSLHLSQAGPQQSIGSRASQGLVPGLAQPPTPPVLINATWTSETTPNFGNRSARSQTEIYQERSAEENILINQCSDAEQNPRSTNDFRSTVSLGHVEAPAARYLPVPIFRNDRDNCSEQDERNAEGANVTSSSTSMCSNLSQLLLAKTGFAPPQTKIESDIIDEKVYVATVEESWHTLSPSASERSQSSPTASSHCRAEKQAAEELGCSSELDRRHQPPSACINARVSLWTKKLEGQEKAQRLYKGVSKQQARAFSASRTSRNARPIVVPTTVVPTILQEQEKRLKRSVSTPGKIDLEGASLSSNASHSVQPRSHSIGRASPNAGAAILRKSPSARRTGATSKAQSQSEASSSSSLLVASQLSRLECKVGTLLQCMKRAESREEDRVRQWPQKRLAQEQNSELTGATEKLCGSPHASTGSGATGRRSNSTGLCRPRRPLRSAEPPQGLSQHPSERSARWQGLSSGSRHHVPRGQQQKRESPSDRRLAELSAGIRSARGEEVRLMQRDIPPGCIKWGQLQRQTQLDNSSVEVKPNTSRDHHSGRTETVAPSGWGWLKERPQFGSQDADVQLMINSSRLSPRSDLDKVLMEASSHNGARDSYLIAGGDAAKTRATQSFNPGSDDNCESQSRGHNAIEVRLQRLEDLMLNIMERGNTGLDEGPNSAPSNEETSVTAQQSSSSRGSVTAWQSSSSRGSPSPRRARGYPHSSARGCPLRTAPCSRPHANLLANQRTLHMGLIGRSAR